MFAEVDAESLFLVGRIWRAHGVRGEVKVIPETDDPERFEDLRVVFTGKTANTVDRREVESVRLQPTKRGILVVLKLRNVDSRDEAEMLRKLSVYAHGEDLPPLDEDEFFLHDLIGLQVVAEDGEEVGVVENVLELPAHEVLVVSRPGASSSMIPVVPEFVVEIDLEAEQITIRPIEGLIE